MTDIATVDMFVVTTVTSKPLAAVSMFSHHRKRVIHFDVTGTRRKSGLRGKSPRPFLGTPHPQTARRPQTGPTAACRIQTVARSAQQQARSDGFSPPCQPACMDSHGFSPIRRISVGSLVLWYLQQRPHQTRIDPREGVGAIAPPGYS
jgi:hypothetical protein